MEKHWTELLEDAGSITRHAYSIKLELLKIDDLKRLIRYHEQAIEELESEALQSAQSDWTKEEIEQAKKEADEINKSKE